MTRTVRNTAGNKGFASGGVMCLVNIDRRALCFYSSVVLVDPEVSGCSYTRPNAKPENVIGHYKRRQ